MASSSGPGRTGPGLWSSALLLVLLTGWFGPVRPLTEPGKWLLDVSSETLKDQSYFLFTKTLFSETFILLKLIPVSCSGSSGVQLNVSWYLRNSHCYNEVISLDGKNMEHLQRYFESTQEEIKGGSGFYVSHQYPPISCQSHLIQLQNFTAPTRLTEHQQTVTESKPPARRKRETVASQSHFNAVAQSWEDGPYMFIVHITEVNENRAPNPPNPDWTLRMEISMKGPHDYISASTWPLMMFYMVMCIVYVLMAVLWLVLSACYWRDLLRIQFWIGGVIFLGMVEKAMYYAEFQSIRYEGHSVPGAVVSAEVVSAVKRTLARVLVIIASLGYGIVKYGVKPLHSLVLMLFIIFLMLYCTGDTFSTVHVCE